MSVDRKGTKIREMEGEITAPKADVGKKDRSLEESREILHRFVKCEKDCDGCYYAIWD